MKTYKGFDLTKHKLGVKDWCLFGFAFVSVVLQICGFLSDINLVFVAFAMQVVLFLMAFATVEQGGVIPKIVFSAFCAFFIACNCGFSFGFDQTQSQYVIHATGGLEGYVYLNSVESFLYYAELGYTYIEIDFMFSADGEVVCTHEFENINGYSVDNRPTHQQFLDSVIHEKYHPLDFDTLCDLLAEYSDIKVVFDSKEQSTTAILEKMIETNNNRIDILDRFIIQVYSKENYNNLQTYNFEEYWFTNYKANYTPSQINAYFGDKQNLTTIVLNIITWKTFKFMVFKTNKYVAVHTVNSNSCINFLKSHGVDYIYTDLAK